jgi:hypothetical protein
MPLTECDCGEQIKENKMGRACGMYGRYENCTNDFSLKTRSEKFALGTEAYMGGK